MIFESREGRYFSPRRVPAESAAPLQSSGKSFLYDFDGDNEGAPPAKFHGVRTGEGPDAKWAVVPDISAPSRPRVVAQTTTEPNDDRFLLLIGDEGGFQDLELGVKFKAVSGEMDRAAGLVFRLKDANNYYLARANALEDNYRVYRIVGGTRRQIPGVNVKVTNRAGHGLRVESIRNKEIPA